MNDHFSGKLDKLTFAIVVILKNVHVVFDEDATSGMDSVNGVVKVLAGFLKTSFVPPRASSCYIEEVGYFDDVELVRKEVRDRKIYYIYYMYLCLVYSFLSLLILLVPIYVFTIDVILWCLVEKSS
jgi:hypothetical protein